MLGARARRSSNGRTTGFGPVYLGSNPGLRAFVQSTHMEILSYIWEYYLYIPLFNLLVWLYLNYSGYNLGVAVVILTILLRLVLLPFTILTERGKIVSDKLSKEIGEIKKDFANDPVQQKVMIRRAMRRYHIRPWTGAIVLGVQLVVLILLYNVFLGGINTEEKLHLLYESVGRPDFINTRFFGINLAVQNLWLSALVAGYVFAGSLIGHWESRRTLSKREQLFTIFFPGFVFLALAMLPAVKSIFILTSLIFGSIISLVTTIVKIGIRQAKKSQKAT